MEEIAGGMDGGNCWWKLLVEWMEEIAGFPSSFFEKVEKVEFRSAHYHPPSL